MPRPSDFRSTIESLWFRLITLSIIALAFTEALVLARGKAQGWSYYLTAPEVAFEVVVRLVAAALAGLALGTICTAVAAPVLGYFRSSRERFVDSTTKIGVFLVVFLASRYALEILIKWSYTWSTHPALYDKLLLAAHFLAFAIALCIPRARRAVSTSLDGLLTDKMTRRTAVATVVGAAAVVATEFVFSKTSPTLKAAFVSVPRPKRNFLLVTFDALDAEDMSLYGYRLPTQYVERNSIFKPLRNGSVGVIDGQYQYVLYLDTQKGVLRPLNEAHIWNLDRSTEDPEKAKALRNAIHQRFPDLIQESA